MIKKKKARDRKGVENLNNYNLIYRNFRIALKDLKEVKSYFWFSFILFFGVALFGFLFPVFFVDEIMEIIKELISKTEGLDVFEMIRFIMANNIQSAFLGMVLGIFLGIFPLVVIISNGYILGFVGKMSVNAENIFVLWRLLPHGIFEIPAILISVALGLRLGILLMQNTIRKNNKNIRIVGENALIIGSILLFYITFFIYFIITLYEKELREKFRESIKFSFRIFIFIVVPLLVVAGVIEGILVGLIG